MKENFFLVIILLLVSSINSNHFLGGTISWRPLNASATGSPVAILITQTYLWAYSLMPCTNALIASNGYIPSYSTVSSDKLFCISNCGSGSTGYFPIGVLPQCTDFSTFLGTSIGQRVDTVNLTSGDHFSVAFQDNSWRTLATGAFLNWSISTNINLKPRSDNGLYDNAPVATVMSPINIPVNQPTVINIPVADADGDPLRCRWSTGVNECGGVCPPSSLPPGTVIYPNCTIIITGQNVGDWFAVTLMVEDFINSTSTTPLSSVPVQFLVDIISAPNCTTPPEIIGTPIEQSCTNVIVGQTFTSQIIAINYCGPTVNISDIATLSFSGIIKSNIIKLNSSVYYKNLTWTPTSAQLGYQVMCAMAYDSVSSQSAQYCFKFYVSDQYECSCPGGPCFTTTTTTTTSTANTTATTSTTSTSASITSATSTTATTSTSTTASTTTATTSTTATTTTQKSDPIDWPLIASIIGLFALAVCCCLCCRYLCPLGARLYRFKKKGPIDLYHIDRCTHPNCHWKDISISPDIFSLPQKKYRIYSSSNDDVVNFSPTRTSLSNSHTTMKSGSIEDANESKMIDFRSDSCLPTDGDRARCKRISSISVTRIKLANKLSATGNRDIKPPNRILNEETNDSSVAKLMNSGKVKVSRIKSTTGPKIFSTSAHLPNNDRIESVEEASPRCDSSDGVTFVRVTHVAAKPSIQHSNNRKPTCLDANDNTTASFRSSGNVKKNKVTVTHVMSAHRQKESTDVLPIESPLNISNNPVSAKTRDDSTRSVRVDRIPTGKKIGKNIVQSDVIVERVPRKNTAK